MVQRTVLKVDISCLKCKKKFLKSISQLRGIDKIEVDADKGTLAVTGDADPYDIIERTRKAGKFVKVVSVGPPPAPQKQEAQKKPEQKKPDPKPEIHNPETCPICQQMAVVYLVHGDDPVVPCSIL